MKYRRAAPIVITVFISVLVVGLVIPLLTPVVMDTNLIMPEYYTKDTRLQILGFFLATYPIAQFFGAPIFGGYSDKYGRKKVLIISLIGTLIGYLMIVYGMMTQNLILVFAGRGLDGFTGGNIPIAYSAVADLFAAEVKAKAFGIVGTIFGIGFIAGLFMGSLLINDTSNSLSMYLRPFWIAMICTVINIMVVMILFKETLTKFVTSNVTVFTGIKNLTLAFRFKNIRSILLANFLFVLGFNFFSQFYQIYLHERFDFNLSEIGKLYAYFGILVGITQGIILQFVVKKISTKNILKYALFFESIFIAMMVWPGRMESLYFIAPFVALFNGFINPTIGSVISNLASKDSQGELLGISQSIISISQAIPPIVSGYLVKVDSSIPTKVAGGLIFLAWLIYMLGFLNKKENQFDIV